jgi:O-antigen/teichoic acid export membrane protein
LRTFLQKKYRALTADKGFSEILTGTAWAMASRVGALVLSLASSLIIARLYGAEAMGILAIVTSVLSIVTVFTVLGTGTSILRMIPEHLAKYSPTSAFRVYRKTQAMVAVASVIAGIILFLLSGHVAESIFKNPGLRGVLSIAAAFVLFKSIMLLNKQAVRGLKLNRTYALLQIMPSLGLIIFLVIGLGLGSRSPEVPAYAQLLAWSFTGILGAIIMYRSFHRLMLPTDGVHIVSTRSILSLSLPMLVAASMQIVISQTGIIILGMHWPTADVGYYALAVRLATLTSFVHNAINTITAPTFSELYHKDQREELFRIARKASRLIFWSTVPILLVLLLVGKPLLALFRPDFVVAYPALAILVFSQFFNSLAGSTNQFMNMTGNQHALRNIMVVAALLNIAFNLALTPRLGIAGTAAAACLSTVFWNAAVLVFIQLRYGQTIIHRPFQSMK